MKIVKPTAVSFSFRTFLVVGRQELCVSGLVGFRLGAGVRRLVSEIALWPAIGEATPGIVDEGLPKPRGEVLLYGSCHAPGGVEVPASMVRMRVASPDVTPDTPALVDKKLAVFGDRFWLSTASRGKTDAPVPSTTKMTEPVPFREMPLAWERAFGGATFARNPLGRGVVRVETVDDVWRVPLPNVELPSSLVTSSTQKPEPAGFGPLDLGWPQRRALAGTYDKRWLEESFPGYARDTDPAFFSTAQPDQRITGFFRGDEEYVLENLHPLAPVLRGRLPGVAARVLVRRKGSDDAEDVPMKLDTLVFLPGMDIGVLVFRGTTPVTEDDAADVAFVLAACEELDAPRPLEHYAKALVRRLDKDQSPLLALNEDDLLPPFAAGTGIADILGKLEDPGKQVRERVFERAMARARKRLVEAKVEDPDAMMAKLAERSPMQQRLERLPDPSDPKDLAEYVAALEELDAWALEREAKVRKSALEKLDEAERRLDERLSAVREHAPAAVDAARREATAGLAQLRRFVKGDPEPEGGPPTGQGPPTPRLPRILEVFARARQVPAPELVKLLEGADVKALEMYRTSAHYRPAARLIDDGARERGRRSVQELAAEGRGLVDLAGTRFDLSGLDLGGVDARGALLEGADLTGTNFGQANLARAVLAHATLRGARFEGAALGGANLGSTMIDGASFASADLRGATLARSKLPSASFEGADVRRVDWLEAELGAVSFEAAIADETTFLHKVDSGIPRRGAPKKPPVPADLTRCRFARARLTKSNFLYSMLQGVDFEGADLQLVTFLTVKADGAIFRGANLRKLHAVVGCSFEGADFRGADLTGASLRGANLRGASFEDACLEGVDMSECDLTGATLPGVRATDAFFVRADLTGANLQRANLMRAMLQKARLHGADLSGSNLFGSNLGLVRMDDATHVRGANLKRALMLPRARGQG